MKTASRLSGKKKSGLPATPLGWTLQPRMPALISMERKRRSVVRLPRPLIAPILFECVAGTAPKFPPAKLARKTLSTF